MKELIVEATKDKLYDVTSFVDGFLEEYDCPMKMVMQLEMAVEEIFVNIASYSYAPKTGNATIRIDTEEDTGMLRIDFIDQGIPYDPLAKEDPNIALSAMERQIGGLGIFMVKKCTDDIAYQHVGEFNVLSIWKKLP